MEFRYQTEQGESVAVRVERAGEGYEVVLACGDEPVRRYTVAARRLRPGILVLELEGRVVEARVAADGGRRHIAVECRTITLEPPAPARARRGAGPGHDSLEATMPGQVIAVNVAPGDAVERGQALVVLEAMKMELRITAPHDGTVQRVACREGQVVERGQVLVELDHTA